MTAYASAGTGNWNIDTNWSPVGVPVAGDTVTINAGHTITVPSAYLAVYGTGLAGTWDLDILGYFYVYGDLDLQGDMRLQTGALVSCSAGSVLTGKVIDPTILLGTTNNGVVTFNCNGTGWEAGNSVQIKGDVGRHIKFTDVLAGTASPQDNVTARFTRFTNVGDSANDAFFTESNVFKTYDFADVVFDNCGRLNFDGQLAPTFTFKYQRILWVNPAVARPVYFATNGTSTTLTSTCYIKDSVLIGDGVTVPSLYIDKNISNAGNAVVFDNVGVIDAQIFLRHGSNYDISFWGQSFAAATQDILLYRGSAEGGSIIHDYVVSTFHSNAHQITGSASLATVTNPTIFENGFSQGNNSIDDLLILIDGAISRNNIGLAGTMHNTLSNAGSGDIKMLHNTHVGTAAHGKTNLHRIETQEPTQNIEVQSNIDYRDDISGDVIENAAGLTADVVNIADYNVQSYKGGGEPACAYHSSVVITAKTCGDAGFGQNDINNNPNFVNEDFRISTWHDTLIGDGVTEQDKTNNAFTELIKNTVNHDRTGAYTSTVDTRYTKSNFLIAARTAFAPTNVALQNNGHDGVTRGALEYVSADTPLTVQSFNQSYSLDVPVLTQANVLSIADILQSSSTDNVLLSQGNIIAIDNVTFSSSYENVALDASLSLIVSDLNYSQSLENSVLSQQNILSVQSALYSVGVDNINITQANVLVVDNQTYSSLLDAILLSVTYPVTTPLSRIQIIKSESRTFIIYN